MSGEPAVPETGSTPLSAEEHLTVSRYLSTVAHVFMLDTFWTRQARAASGGVAGEGREGRVAALGAVVDELDQQVALLGRLAGELRPILATHAGTLRAALGPAAGGRERAAGGLLSDPRLGTLAALLDSREGDVVDVLLTAADQVAARTDEERAVLRAEYGRLTGGKGSDGDLTDEQWRDVELIALGAAAVLGPEAGAVVLAVGGLLDLLFG